MNKGLAISALVVAIFLPRLVSLGTVLTIDEPLWLGRGGVFIRAVAVGQFEQTSVAYQPGVTTAWLVGLVHRFDSLAAAQGAIAVATGILILLITYFLSRMWGWKWAIVAGFMLALDPFLLGHSRVVHTDAVLALLYTASLCALLVGLHTTTAKRYVLYSGILGGLALLTKLFALVLFPTVGLLLAWFAWRKRIEMTQAMKILLFWIGVAVLTAFIFWPAMWTSSVEVLTYLSERGSVHVEGSHGEAVTAEPWYYVRAVAVRTTPVTALFVIAALPTLFRRKLDTQTETACLLIVAGIIYIAVLSVGSDKAARYILFTLISLNLLAVVGLRACINVLHGYWPTLRRYTTPLVVLLGIVLAADAYRLHPYYLSHYNRLYPIEDTHKLGWGEGLELAADWIQQTDPNAKVASYYSRVFSHFAPVTMTVVPATHYETADYLVIYRGMYERGPDAPETEIVNEFLRSGKHEPAQVFSINGLPYVWIFRLTQQ